MGEVSTYIDVLSVVVKENKHQNTKDTKCRRGYAEMNLDFLYVREGVW
jgi:hypothetical protein